MCYFRNPCFRVVVVFIAIILIIIINAIITIIANITIITLALAMVMVILQKSSWSFSWPWSSFDNNMVATWTKQKVLTITNVDCNLKLRFVYVATCI